MSSSTWALRSLKRTPGATLAAVITFALGMGANLAIFSVIDRLMFRPLPYSGPERLVQLHDRTMSLPNLYATLPQYVGRELMQRASSFEGFGYAGVASEMRRVEELGGAQVRLAHASDNLLDLLGVRPVLGSVPRGKDVAESPAPLLLTHETWRTHFAANAEIIGSTIRAGSSYQIVGVLPDGFLLPSSQLAGEVHGVVLERSRLDRVQDPRLLINAPVAKLRSGITVEEAQAEVDVLYQQIETPGAVRTRASRVFVQPLQEGMFFLYRAPLWLVVATGGVVLLAGCINLATLLLARSRAAAHTRAIRVALGAPFRQLLSTTVLETVLICGAGAVVAIVVCAWTHQLLLSVVPPAFRGFATPPIDTRLVLLSFSVAILVSLVASIAPVLHARRTDPLETLGRRSRDGSERLRGGSALLALQAVFGVVLVAGGVLMVGSYVSLVMSDRGWTVDDLFQLRVSHGQARTDDGYDKGRVLKVIETVQASPGVIAAGAANRRPFDNYGLIGDQWKALGHEGGAWGVSAGLFQAMGMTLRAGRLFTHEEVARKDLVVVLNESGVARLWPGTAPAVAIGRMVRTFDGERVVLGVVDNIQRYPGEAAVAGMYLPLTADEMGMSQSAVEVVVRVEPGRLPDLPVIRARLDAQFGVENLEPATRVSEMLASWFERPRFLAALLGCFALIALTLAALGVFAVSSFDAQRRRQEMAVRVMLGATRRDLSHLIMRAVVRPIVAGSLVGLLVTWWAARLVGGLVTGISAADPRLLVAVAAFFVTVAAAAAWIPARRAALADPVETLSAN